ncbi:hypothetical protein EVAR_38250_1 [Eumeta japonica]|uniref:Uncharacterized protein n=1 Tax=Eumeta variegata TaxID=151549 RepID=A0A4C1YBL5_EUMVA|nr:hypothetical protein EVAR_38250_1 [Eumeta japonica]
MSPHIGPVCLADNHVPHTRVILSSALLICFALTPIKLKRVLRLEIMFDTNESTAQMDKQQSERTFKSIVWHSLRHRRTRINFVPAPHASNT